MLSKCANPACSARFRFFHEGQLFRVERRPDGPGDSGKAPSSPPRRIEFYWLCEVCATRMTVVYHPETGITVTPTIRSLRAAS